GSKEITNLEKDNLLDIPRDAKVVSDKLTEGSKSWALKNIDCISIYCQLPYSDPSDASKDLIANNIVKEKEFNMEFKKYNIKVDLKKYNQDKKYREKINYYYYLEKYSLNKVKYSDIKFIDEKTIEVIDKQGRKQILEKTDADLYHNVMEIDGKIYINADKKSKNQKYTNKDGYEIIINKNEKKVIDDPINRGTFNHATKFNVIEHFYSDVRLYREYGTGFDDNTTKEKREKIDSCSIKMKKNYSKIKFRDLEMVVIVCE
ncbi:hypothetical protein HP397_06720, partial [Streptobacillus felis]|nr:hypothetical protein [Streptobacillus felis]